MQQRLVIFQNYATEP